MLQKISKNRLKRIRQLRQKKYRKEYGLYLISGLRAVQEALTSPDIKVKSILIAEQHLALMNELPHFECQDIFSLDEKAFNQVVEEKTPQGIALIAQRPEPGLDADRLPSRVLFLEKASDPGNLGTLLRSAAWFGWTTILLSPGSVDPYAPKTVRASAGSIAHLSVYENISAENLAEIKARKNYRLVAATVREGQNLKQFFIEKDRPLILALGSEAHGLSQAVLKISDLRLRIPGSGRVESLNLAMAGTIFLYHFSLINQPTLSGRDLR